MCNKHHTEDLNLEKMQSNSINISPSSISEIKEVAKNIGYSELNESFNVSN